MEQQPITVELDDELYRWLCERAAAANRSVGDFAGDLIEEDLRKQAKVAVKRQQATRGDFRYHINVFWYPDDDCWVADVPDLKPCSAHGDTPEEAIAEAQVAIELWIETATERRIPIPEARYRPAIYAAA